MNYGNNFRISLKWCSTFVFNSFQYCSTKRIVKISEFIDNCISMFKDTMHFLQFRILWVSLSVSHSIEEESWTFCLVKWRKNVNCKQFSFPWWDLIIFFMLLLNTPSPQIRSVTIHLFILVKLAHWFHDFATQNKSIIWVEF